MFALTARISRSLVLSSNSQSRATGSARTGELQKVQGQYPCRCLAGSGPCCSHVAGQTVPCSMERNWVTFLAAKRDERDKARSDCDFVPVKNRGNQRMM